MWTCRAGKVDSIDPGQCSAAAIWDGVHLFVASNGTTVRGAAVGGSVRELNPATGKPIWETGLSNPILGSPTLDGSGVLAVATYNCQGKGTQNVYLIDAPNGTIKKTIAMQGRGVFAQPVFADSYLLIAPSGGALRAYAVR